MSLLVAPPGDGISNVSFSPTKTDLLLVSSWDSTCRLYNVAQNCGALFTFDFGGASLTCCFDSTGTQGFATGLDESVYSLDLARGAKTEVGRHENAVSCAQFCNTINALFTGSWDKTVRVWDPRSGNNGSSSSGAGSSSSVISLAHKVYSLSCAGTKLVVATADRQVFIYDVRNLAQPEQVRESPLRHQTRRVACDPLSCDGFVIGSTEGRVGVEYFDPSEQAQARKYAFKCHRRDDRAFPVNALAFHPVYGSFATGGGDGTVCIWDGANRKRLTQLPVHPAPVSSLAFSSDGSMLAVASSYSFEEGAEGLGKNNLDNIYIHHISEVDCRPRMKESWSRMVFYIGAQVPNKEKYDDR